MSNTAVLVLLIVMLIAAAIFIPRFRMKRAISQVIQALREHNAIGPKNAKTIDELGLSPRSFMEGMFRGRDYKPYALDSLTKSEIIKITEEGKLYLSEAALEMSELYRR